MFEFAAIKLITKGRTIMNKRIISALSLIVCLCFILTSCGVSEKPQDTASKVTASQEVTSQEAASQNTISKNNTSKNATSQNTTSQNTAFEDTPVRDEPLIIEDILSDGRAVQKG